MSRLTYAQKAAFAKTVAQFLKDNMAGLKAAGFDPTSKMSALNDAVEKSVEDDATQENMKAELSKATIKAVNSLTKAYTLASSMMDAMVGVIGKDQPLAKRFRQLRDQMVKEAARGKRTKT